jgi:hypothetical protein
MIFSAPDALYWTKQLIAVAIIFQTMEMLKIRNTFNATGVWRWETLKEEFEFLPALARRFLDWSLDYPHFLGVLGIRLAAAITLLFVPHATYIILIFMTTILISLRWRGTFNGGSDFMTLIILTALCVAPLFAEIPKLGGGCLWYIAIQACTSYFIAGFIKLKRTNWRNGRALSGFLESTIYPPAPFLQWVAHNSSVARIASWGVMVFEFSFPAALLNSHLCLFFIGLALIFHLANFYIFGLNRFLFAWAAAYPALYYCSELNK